MDWAAPVGATIATAVTGAVGWIVSRGRERAAAQDVLSQASDRLMKALSADNEMLRNEVRALREDVHALHEQREKDRVACETELAALRATINRLHPNQPKRNP